MTRFSKILLVCALLGAGILSFIFWPLFSFSSKEFSADPPASEDLPLIALTQVIEHHTLDTVRAGLLAELEAQGYTQKIIKIVYENAHGNVVTAAQIASRFASLHPKVMVALSTQSAQSLVSLSASAHIPLVFTAVTNPLAAKLVLSRTQAAPLITGVSDFMKPEPQLEMMRAFVPGLTRLGILYNPAEINSVSFLKEMEEVAKTQGIKLVYAPLNNTSEATSATLSLIDKVNAIYFPNDNTAMAAVDTIALTALKHGIPVFANDSASVEQGVLAAVAYDRFAMGRKTGEIVIAILRGKKPEEIPVVYDTPFEVVVNEKTLRSLNLSLPQTLQTIRKL